MTVQPVLLRAVSDPVLDDRKHAGRVDAGSAVLKSFDVCFDEIACELGVFAESAADATPPRLRREICLRRECLFDADCAVLLPRDVPESTHERCVARRREAERL